MSTGNDYQFAGAGIAIFARIPQPGRVKTRLARRIGNIPATRAYRQMAEKTIRRVSQARLAPVTVYGAPHHCSALFRRWRRDYGVALRQQPAGDLGRRMNQVLGQCLRHKQAAIVIGTDAPALEVEQIAIALQKLHEGADAVFIPCEDGGYALAGLSRHCQRLFTGIPWGSSRVMQITRTRMTTTGAQGVLLPWSWDVDDATDLRRARRSGVLRQR